MIKCLINNHPYALFEGLYNDSDLRKMSKDKLLICPQCGNPYSYCHGGIKMPYFRHVHNFACVDPEPETEEHIRGKISLYKYFKKFSKIKNLDLETYISSQALRPDITFFIDDQQYAIEYQCSPISTEYEERHEKYVKEGIKDIWICGTEKYFGMKKNFNHLEKKIDFYFDSSYGDFLKTANSEKIPYQSSIPTYPHYIMVQDRVYTYGKRESLSHRMEVVDHRKQWETWYHYRKIPIYGDIYRNRSVFVGIPSRNMPLELVLKGGVECQE